MIAMLLAYVFIIVSEVAEASTVSKDLIHLLTALQNLI